MNILLIKRSFFWTNIHIPINACGRDWNGKTKEIHLIKVETFGKFSSKKESAIEGKIELSFTLFCQIILVSFNAMSSLSIKQLANLKSFFFQKHTGSANMPLKASGVFETLVNVYSFDNTNGDRELIETSASLDDDNSTENQTNPFDFHEEMFSEDGNFQSDALLTICGKILHDFPTLDINEFINSNKSDYLPEEFTNQISSVGEEDDTQLPSTST